jgi:hypothetical protein
MGQEQLLDTKTPTARKTRTLYVREEDQEIWDQAKELVGDSLSMYITNHLKALVASEKAAQKGFERIVLKFTHGKIPQAKAFYGRWIISPQQPFRTQYRDDLSWETSNYAVATTAKNKVVIFVFRKEKYGEESYDQASMHVLDSLEELAVTSEFAPNLVGEVMKRLGIEIQELDI